MMAPPNESAPVLRGGGSSPLRVGVIGANPTRGWGTSAHLPALQALDEFEIAAVATSKLETAQITADKFQVPHAYGSAAELVEDPSVELVAVTVKVPEHDALIRMALEAGKHVYCEWPLGIDLAQATSLAELASRSGAQHMVGLQGLRALGPLFVRQLIDRGTIGLPVAVGIVAPGSPAGNRVHQSNAYAADRRAGATVLSISTGHILATLSSAISEFVELSAQVSLVNTSASIVETGEVVEVSSPDQVSVTGTLANGAVATIAVLGGNPGSAQPWEIRIVGTEGTLTVRPSSPGGMQIASWTVSATDGKGDTRLLPIPTDDVGIPEAVRSGPPMNIAILYRELARAIRADEPAIPNFNTAVEYHQLLGVIERASETGQRQPARP
jgi:predicted dehydrogenase